MTEAGDALNYSVLFLKDPVFNSFRLPFAINFISVIS